MGRPGEFLRELGVPKAQRLGPAAFNEIRRRCGPSYLKEFQDAVKNAETLRNQGVRTDVALEDLYTLMYRDLDSAIATHVLSSEVTVAWLRWTDSRMPTEGRLLDLGCGIGIISCWHAQHSPDLEVVGIDRDPNAVEVASSLAERLELSNVRFEVSDYRSDDGPSEAFDHAICVTVANSDLDDFATLARRFPTARAMADRSATFRGHAATALGRSVTAGGQVWSLERLPDFLMTLQWWYQLRNAGLDVEPPTARTKVGPREHMPITVAVKSPAGSDAVELAKSSFQLFGYKPEIDRRWSDGPP